MKKIHHLPQQIVAKIAAGEVIERPVYAVKELVENAIDAGANAISVHIEESGMKKITVIDNGEGMSPEDLKESFKPHTTSKIAKEDELAHIKTLGFRGEALASIAAVSRVTINSRVSNAVAGTSVIVKNSKFENIAPIGIPAGTSVTVEHLFSSHPVRKKFFTSPRKEFRHILDLLIGYSLSYPEIHFTLTHNKRSILDLPHTKELLPRIEKLLGKEIFSSLVPVEFTDAHIAISGFLAKPSFNTRSPNKQFLFINNRLVTDKGISQTVKSAYGSLLAASVYPVCLLYFSLPHEMVDVNVHPRKEVVRFIDTQLLFDAIKRAVLKTLAGYDLTPDFGFASLIVSDAVGSTGSYTGKLLKEKKLPWQLSSSEPEIINVVQMHKLYLLIVTDNGFYIIDQHAAHERILYEQLQKEFTVEKKKYSVFHFPKPGVFELTLSESELLHDYLEMFQSLGWDIEHFKNNTFIIRSLPVIFQDRDYVTLLREMLDDLMEDNLKKNIDDVSKKMIAYLACRSAVKSGDTLTKKQAKELVLQLVKTENNATCPHGRPTRIAIELEKINRLFKR